MLCYRKKAYFQYSDPLLHTALELHMDRYMSLYRLGFRGSGVLVSDLYHDAKALPLFVGLVIRNRSAEAFYRFQRGGV